MKLDILAIGVHPDDVELGSGGAILRQISHGNKVGILDLTQGELGTRGTAETRRQEAAEAAKILGVAVRDNLGFEDGFFTHDKTHVLEVVKIIRKYQPEVVLMNATYDRHPDHGRSAELVRDAVFLSGLAKIETKFAGEIQTAFRPKAAYSYIQALHAEPDFVVDISNFFEQKMQAILAYKTQFFNPAAQGENTFISSPEFLDFVKARAVHFGVPSGVKYAEGFTVHRTPMIKDLLQLY